MPAQNTKNKIKIAFAGDGIASRAMALALARHGFATTIIAPKSAPFIGGLQLAPNGWAALEELGLAEDAQDHALPLAMMRMLSLETRYSLIPISLNDRKTRRPYTSMTRRGLHDLLKTAAEKTKLVSWTDAHIKAVKSQDQQAVITFDDGQSLKADWLIGGDGAHGICRNYVTAEAQHAPHHFTRKAFRMIIPAEACPQGLIGHSSHIWLGDGGHIVHYPLADGHLNFVAVMPKAANIESLCKMIASSPHDRHQQGHQHGHPQGDFLINYIQDHQDQVITQPLYRHAPLDALQRGRVVLTGDAAHPMPPHLAQGAGQSLIDAASMMAILGDDMAADIQDLQPYITKWAAMRNRQVKRITRQAERAGEVFALDGPLAKIRNLGLSTFGSRILIKQLEDLWSS